MGKINLKTRLITEDNNLLTFSANTGSGSKSQDRPWYTAVTASEAQHIEQVPHEHVPDHNKLALSPSFSSLRVAPLVETNGPGPSFFTSTSTLKREPSRVPLVEPQDPSESRIIPQSGIRRPSSHLLGVDASVFNKKQRIMDPFAMRAISQQPRNSEVRHSAELNQRLKGVLLGTWDSASAKPEGLVDPLESHDWQHTAETSAKIASTGSFNFQATSYRKQHGFGLSDKSRDAERTEGFISREPQSASLRPQTDSLTQLRDAKFAETPGVPFPFKTIDPLDLAWIAALQFDIPENVYQEIKQNHLSLISRCTEQLSMYIETFRTRFTRSMDTSLKYPKELTSLIGLIWYLNYIVLGNLGVPVTDQKYLAEQENTFRSLLDLLDYARKPRWINLEEREKESRFQRLLKELVASDDDRFVYQYKRRRYEKSKPMLVISRKQLIAVEIAVNLLASCYKSSNDYKWDKLFENIEGTENNERFLNLFLKTQARRHCEVPMWEFKPNAVCYDLTPWNQPRYFLPRNGGSLGSIYSIRPHLEFKNYLQNYDSVHDERKFKKNIKIGRSLKTVFLNQEEYTSLVLSDISAVMEELKLVPHEAERLDDVFQYLFRRNHTFEKFFVGLKILTTEIWILNLGLLNGFGRTSKDDTDVMYEQISMQHYLLKILNPPQEINSRTHAEPNCKELQLRNLIFSFIQAKSANCEVQSSEYHGKPEKKESFMKIGSPGMTQTPFKVLISYYKKNNWSKWQYIFKNKGNFILNLGIVVSSLLQTGAGRIEGKMHDIHGMPIIPWGKKWIPTKKQQKRLIHVFQNNWKSMFNEAKPDHE